MRAFIVGIVAASAALVTSVAAAGPPRVSSAPTDEDRISTPSPSPSQARGPGRELASITVGVEAGGRHLRYVDALSPGLRDYSLTAAPLMTVRGAIYPLADASPVVDVGVVGAYARAFALASSATGAGSIDTGWTRFHAGGVLRLRLPSVVVAIGGAYAGETFTFGSSAIDAQSPAVDYRIARVSTDVRVPWGRFAILAGGAYDAVLSSGAVADRFPHATVGGVDATLGVTLRLTRAVELVAIASYRRFFYAMNPVPGEARVAGGALDELYGLQGGASYAF